MVTVFSVRWMTEVKPVDDVGVTNAVQIGTQAVGIGAADHEPGSGESVASVRKIPLGSFEAERLKRPECKTVELTLTCFSQAMIHCANTSFTSSERARDNADGGNLWA